MACEPRVACEPRSEWFRPSRLRKNHPLRPRRGRLPTHIAVPARRGRGGLLQGSARRENHPLPACGGILPTHITVLVAPHPLAPPSLCGKLVAGASRQPKASLLPDRDGPSGLPLVVKGFKMVRARVYMRRGMGTQRTRVPHTPLRQGWPGRLSGKARGTGVPDPKEVPHGRRSWSQSIMQFPRGGACSRLCRVASELASPSACAP